MKFKYYLRGAGFGVIVSTVILSIAFLFQDNMSDAEIMRRAMELGMVMEEGSQGTLADMIQQGVTKVDMETGTDDSGENTPDTGVNPEDGQTTSDTGAPDGQAGNMDSPDNQAGGADALDGQAAGVGNSQAGNAQNQGSEGNQGPGGTGDSDKNEAGSEDGKKQPDAQKPDKAKEDKKDKDSDSDKTSDNQDGNSDIVTIEVVGGDVSRVVSEKLQGAGLIDDSEEFNSYMGSNGYANNIQPGTFKIKKGSSFKQIADILTSR